MKIFSLKLLFLFFISNFFTSTRPAEWRFIKDVEGIQVYFRESENSPIKEVKMKTTFNARLSSIAQCLKDVDRYPEWVYKATYSKTVLKYNENDIVYYTYMDFPWPLQDRDIVVQSRISQDPTTRVIVTESFAKWEAVAMQKNVVRIQSFNSIWKLTPLDNGKVAGEYVFKSNPGGVIPAVAVNLGLDEGPLKTLKAFKRILKEEKYRNVKNEFKD